MASPSVVNDIDEDIEKNCSRDCLEITNIKAAGKALLRIYKDTVEFDEIDEEWFRETLKAFQSQKEQNETEKMDESVIDAVQILQKVMYDNEATLASAILKQKKYAFLRLIIRNTSDDEAAHYLFDVESGKRLAEVIKEVVDLCAAKCKKGANHSHVHIENAAAGQQADYPGFWASTKTFMSDIFGAEPLFRSVVKYFVNVFDVQREFLKAKEYGRLEACGLLYIYTELAESCDTPVGLEWKRDIQGKVLSDKNDPVDMPCVEQLQLEAHWLFEIEQWKALPTKFDNITIFEIGRLLDSLNCKYLDGEIKKVLKEKKIPDDWTEEHKKEILLMIGSLVKKYAKEYKKFCDKNSFTWIDSTAP